VVTARVQRGDFFTVLGFWAGGTLGVAAIGSELFFRDHCLGLSVCEFLYSIESKAHEITVAMLSC
jgi:hypothetical protein